MTVHDDPLNSLRSQADRLMLGVTWFLALMSFPLAAINGTWVLATVIGLPAALVVTAMVLARPGRLETRLTVAAILMIFCALHIHQSGGMIEVHFGFFVLLAFLLAYRDWRPIIVAAGVAAVHHLSFNYLQELGYGVMCFARPGLELVLIHAAYVVADAGLLCFLAWHMECEAIASNEVMLTAKAIATGDLQRSIADHGRRLVRESVAPMMEMQSTLSRSMAEIKMAAGVAARGDFSRRADTGGLQGFQLELAQDVNNLISTCESGLRDVSGVLEALAAGDLTRRMERDCEGLFAKLKEDANKTAGQLGEIVVRIKNSADTINVASKEIALGNADLSQRTEVQASSLEETASSMEELTSTVKQNAENAKQANQLAVGASEVATRGGKVVREVVSTMEGITESSRKIADIIGVIDGIAFQTNILALNAAVEAARAGEQGRGFAVVATEVRNLAQRSAAAAKEIKTLIGDSVGKVEAGSRQVDEAGKTMAEILTSVKRVTDIMAEITAASQEQSSGIEQVSSAVAKMDEVTQQNAALVEQAAAAAESLRGEAAKLVQSTLIFKLKDQDEFLERTRTAAAELIRQFPEGIQSDRRAETAHNGMKLPGLCSGDRVVTGDEEVVDGLKKRLGVVATIFACDDSEFVRVSTSVLDERGKRVLGTRLDPSHPAVACLVGKLPYEGSMVLFGQAYMTRYSPIVDLRGSLIGAFFVGVEMSASGHAQTRAKATAPKKDTAERSDPSLRTRNIVRLDPAPKAAPVRKVAARVAGNRAAAAVADGEWQEF